MKNLFKLFLGIVFFFGLLVNSDAQTIRAEIDELHKQIPDQLSMGNLDKVVELAEQIADREKSLGKANIEKYVAALANVGLWKRQWLNHVIANRKGYSFRSYLEVSSNAVDSLEKVLRISIKLLETEVNDPVQLAAIKSELGSVLFQFRNFKKSRDEIELLLKDSLELYEKTLGSDAESVAVINERMSLVYFVAGEFDLYLPAAERHISKIRSKKKPNGDNLVKALQTYAEVLTAVDREDDARVAMAEIAAISGIEQKEPPKTPIILRRAASKIDLYIGVPAFLPGSMELNYPIDPSVSGASVVTWTDNWGNSNRTVALPNLPSSGNRTNPAIGTLNTTNLRGVSYTRISVLLKVNSSGRVFEVNPLTTDEKIKKKVIAHVKKWKFNPFTQNGTAGTMQGKVNLLYWL